MTNANNPYRRPAPGQEPPKPESYPHYVKVHLYPNRHERRRMAKLIRSMK